MERALELAEGLRDRRALGHLYFQASLLAERSGQWVLARSYAERAKAQYEEVADRQNVGRLLNNLGGLNFLLGKPDEAIRHLKDAFATALEVGSETDAAQAVSSLAQVHLRTGRRRARRGAGAAGACAPRTAATTGSTRPAARSSCSAGRCSTRAGSTRPTPRSPRPTRRSSSSAREVTAPSAWVAQGDLAARRGDDRAAARLYRRAAEALQDVRF